MHLLLRTGSGGARAASLVRMRCAASPAPLRLPAALVVVPGRRPPPPTLRWLARSSSSSSSSGTTTTSTTTTTTTTAAIPSTSPPSSPTPNFCRHCGAAGMQTRVPEGDTHAREVCPACGVVEYRNPRMVVGVIVARGFGGGSASRAREVLLCRRAIEPARGRWTLPAGYLEVGESTAQGAQREALEETGADVEVLRPFAHFDVPAIGQAYLLFLARLQAGGRPPAASTPESLESRWFRVDSAGGGESGGGGGGGGDALEEVPWSELAFSSVSTALRLYAEDVAAAAAAAESGEEGADADAFPSARRYRQHHGVIERQPGAGPNQAGTYRLVDHTWSGGGGGR